MSTTATRDPEPILVLGDGGWGTALAMVLSWNGHGVHVWGYDREYCRLVDSTRRNPKFLEGVEVPQGITFGSEIEQFAERVRIIFSVIPTQFLARSLAGLAHALPKSALVVSCSKGFERGTLALPSQRLRQLLPSNPVVVLSGPSHAEEVSRRLPTTVVVAAEDPAHARTVQQLVSTSTFRAYTSSDPLGVEIAGASKNVIALAAGISDGLGFGDNARAALICRGAREITRLGLALGARRETFSGLSGIGDLIVTCTSQHSRNHTVGFRIGRGETLAEILRSTEKIAEGVETTRSLVELRQRIAVDLPITMEVHAVLFEGKPPREAVASLMMRELKDEELG
jgi:glycerol-3-phosphate dehydrogenase (NAD(P)+)